MGKKTIRSLYKAGSVKRFDIVAGKYQQLNVENDPRTWVHLRIVDDDYSSGCD